MRMNMNNPWEEIRLDDYENHMKLDSVMQLQTMNSMMKEQFEAYPVNTAMVLGVAGGNGLEHVRKDKYQTVYGVDINEDYLKATKERYPGLSGTLECIKADLINEPDKLPHSELVIANLLIEYIGYDAFRKAIRKVSPEYVSCIIQINTDESQWVSDSPYLHAFDRLDEVHCQMEENELTKAMTDEGYSLLLQSREMLPNGKALLRLDYCVDDRTLYVSDLDGTLMRNNEKLSSHTVDTINALLGKGLAFTYATARSIESARPIAGGLNLKLPVITRNGAVLADNMTGRHLQKSVFTEEETVLLRTMLPELPKYGFVSCFIGEDMIRTYMPGEHSEGLQGYIDYYADDPSMRKVDSLEEMFTGIPGYVTMIGVKEDIAPLYERVREYKGWESLFQKDTYRDEYWIEICPRNCTKAKTILKLKEQLGYKRLVVFGDSLNDISMFRIADESYAVSNAMDELKAIATGVIGSNEDDSVAEFIKERFALTR